MHFNWSKIKTIGKRIFQSDGIQLTMIAMSIIFLFWMVVAFLFPATVHVTLTDASEEILPTKFTDVFRIYLVEYPNEKDSEYIELTPSAEEKVPKGVYHLRVYCDEKRFPESKGVLLYDEKIILSGFARRSRNVQLDSVFMRYEIYATSPRLEYLEEPFDNKVVIKTDF